VDLSIVVPVYNNASTLEELIDRLCLVLGELPLSWEAIFVDDGSRDGSLAVLERRAAADARLRVFPLTRNFGGQAAICAGFDQVRGKRTVCMDADLENFPEDIPALLSALDAGHDLACGVREGRRDALLTRKLPSALLNAYVRRQTGTRVRDIGCGMRAMESWIVHGLAGEGEQRRLITPLLLRRARSVAQIPIRHRPKGIPGGHSFLTLLGIAMDYYLLTARRPFLVAGLLAVAATFGGVLLLALGSGSWRLGGLVLAVGGLLGGLLSLVGEYAQRLYQVGQDLPFYQILGEKSEEPRSGQASDDG
jgi:glycosyltransferase involved in cell wall biosynthesis